LDRPAWLVREGIRQKEHLDFEVVKCHAAKPKTRFVKHTEPRRMASYSAANNTKQALPLKKIKVSVLRLIPREMLRQILTLVQTRLLRSMSRQVANIPATHDANFVAKPNASPCASSAAN